MEITQFTLQDDLGNDLLSDKRIPDLLSDLTSKIIDDINKKRLAVIKERLNEVLGIELNIEDEAKRRFKRLSIEYRDNEEIIYYNDGSLNGIRVVTFVKKDNPIRFNDPLAAKMSFEFSYY